MTGPDEHDEQHDEQRDQERDREHERQEGGRGSSREQRRRWRQRAVWLSQLSLTPGDDVPVEAVQEVADAVVVLLDELEQLESRLGDSGMPLARE